METKILVDPGEEPHLYDRLSNAAETLNEISDAKKTFEEIVGPRAARFVQAEWSQVEAPGPSGPKRTILLKLTDPFSETKEETFQPVELRSPPHMKTRLLRVWGEFLQQLSHKQMDRLDEMVKTLERD